jgi:hypothetical protein
MSAADLTDGELTWIIKNSPEYAALRDIDGRRADAPIGLAKID